MYYIDKKYQNLLRSISPLCKSQLGQEVFALNENKFVSNGFFVEFGATNGVELSNTFILEKEFGWSGILAEPAKIWHDDLLKNRSCHIEKKCVWSKSGELISFHESDAAVLSTASIFAENTDMNKEDRIKGIKYNIETISLEDLLKKYNAPHVINYLSIDTEGSEYQILSNFDFNSYDIRAITVEHNFMPDREKLYKLLTSHGFFRVQTDKSKWDDWYTKNKPIFLYV